VDGKGRVLLNQPMSRGSAASQARVKTVGGLTPEVLQLRG